MDVVLFQDEIPLPLQSFGIDEIFMFGGYCPFQIEFTRRHRNARQCGYFRSRGDSAYLYLLPADEELSLIDRGEWSFEDWDEFMLGLFDDPNVSVSKIQIESSGSIEAGYISEDRAFAVFHALIKDIDEKEQE